MPFYDILIFIIPYRQFSKKKIKEQMKLVKSLNGKKNSHTTWYVY